MVLRFLFLSISLSCSPLLFRNFADSSPDRQIRTSSECRSAHNAPLERRVPTSRGYFPSAQSRRGHSLANNIARPYSEILIFHYSGRFVCRSLPNWSSMFHRTLIRYVMGVQLNSRYVKLNQT